MRCEICGKTRKIEKHHIIPVSLGGEDVLENWQWLCRKCHVKVHSKQDHWAIWGQRGGKKTAHESAPLKWLFTLTQFKESPEKRRAYVLNKYPDLITVYEAMEVEYAEIQRDF